MYGKHEGQAANRILILILIWVWIEHKWQTRIMFWIIISEWRGVERPGCCSKLSLQSSMMRMDWCFLRSWVIQSEQSWPWLSTTADILLVEMDKMLHKFYQLAVTTATTNIRYLLLYFVLPWQLGVAWVLGSMREIKFKLC